MAVVVDALRTPIGKIGGVLSSIRPDDLLGHAVRAMAVRHGLESVDDVVAGCANQSGEDGRNVARMAVILAGLPFTVPAQTVNRLCGSSMQAMMTAAHALDAGFGDVMLAGGVESMSRGAYAFAKAEKPFAFGHLQVYDTTLGWRFHNPKIHERVRPLSMGETAEEIFQNIPVSREDQDVFAFESHHKALAAWKSGKFNDEVVPIVLTDKKSERRIERDEGPREDTTLEKLSSLKPAFRADGTVTAGNSCPLNDGASMTLMMTEQEAKRRGFKTCFRLKSAGVTALHPDVMGLGPVEASRLALRRAGLSVGDLGLIELNEAFAIQAIACMRELGLPADRVNVNGGAIAIGHPLGCSGARIVGTLIHEMRRRNVRYGLATMCIGVGQGIATVWEKIEI